MLLARHVKTRVVQSAIERGIGAVNALIVIPAKAGIQPLTLHLSSPYRRRPDCAGMDAEANIRAANGLEGDLQMQIVIRLVAPGLRPEQKSWIPAFAGMTSKRRETSKQRIGSHRGPCNRQYRPQIAARRRQCVPPSESAASNEPTYRHVPVAPPHIDSRPACERGPGAPASCDVRCRADVTRPDEAAEKQAPARVLFYCPQFENLREGESVMHQTAEPKP